MGVSSFDILDILARYGIHPFEDERIVDLPGIGEIGDGEGVYGTSLDSVLGADDDLTIEGGFPLDIPRIEEWWAGIARIVDDFDGGVARATRDEVYSRRTVFEPHCAWYCPIHFFGHGWGIYIRENCILSHAAYIASFVPWKRVHLPAQLIAKQLLRSAFYAFFLHEQFHHKVESFGFRLLVSTNTDRYRPYKFNVYSKSFGTSDCLEESLANAESYRRLNEERYTRRVDPAIRKGLRDYLKISFRMQPPGYREAINYLQDASYRNGLFHMQSLVLDGMYPSNPPLTRPDHWLIAPNMITALADISEEIYVVLPRGARPIFPVTTIDPGATASTRDLESALTKHHGYKVVPGGKGSHIKLSKPGAPTIVLPGNRPVLSPGVVKQALQALGGYPLSKLPELLDGRLVA
jgi:HicA toxin of bacterial toxin-antitoxin,